MLSENSSLALTEASAYDGIPQRWLAYQKPEQSPPLLPSERRPQEFTSQRDSLTTRQLMQDPRANKYYAGRAWDNEGASTYPKTKPEVPTYLSAAYAKDTETMHDSLRLGWCTERVGNTLEILNALGATALPAIIEASTYRYYEWGKAQLYNSIDIKVSTLASTLIDAPPDFQYYPGENLHRLRLPDRLFGAYLWSTTRNSFTQLDSEKRIIAEISNDEFFTISREITQLVFSPTLTENTHPYRDI